jgi:ubiquinone/menaquinone biosynthesis C-methylase UbiE
MSPIKKPPLAQAVYDKIAEEYAARVDTKAHNAYLERPATLSLLPDVRGQHVLDAGCGPGVYTEWLVEHGAQVIALDGNSKMVKLAQQRLGKKAEILQANLEAPLDFLQDRSFDVVVCPLVLDYIQDWEAIFKEFHRLLRPGGHLVFSIGHPFEEYEIRRQTSNYFDLEQVEYTWRGFGITVNMPSYRRPLGKMINPLLVAGFRLERILEPQPLEQFKQADPEDYDKVMKTPSFICFRAVKDQ